MEVSQAEREIKGVLAPVVGGEMMAACVAGGGQRQLPPEPPSGPRRWWWSRSCPLSFSAGLTTKALALTLGRGSFAASLPLPELLPNP